MSGKKAILRLLHSTHFQSVPNSLWHMELCRKEENDVSIAINRHFTVGLRVKGVLPVTIEY